MTPRGHRTKMATSLARQLQRLELPGQPSLQLLASKKRPSFLFESREAGDVDTETIFHLATNGLEELVSIDKTFTAFQDTLFSETFKSFERTHVTEEEAEKLDHELERFLFLVSPYFLLKPSHKCLEWLVRVFRINSFNVDHVMQCILPYYQTNLFVRMLQLLPLKSHTSPWHWLRPLQKSGTPLSQQAIINHCIADHAFLVFVCELAGKSVKHNKHQPVCSQSSVALYTSVLVGVLEGTKKITENLVTLLSPYLRKGLRSKNSDFYSSSLILVTALSSRVLLVERLVHSFMEGIAKHLKLECERESILCLSYLSNSQKQKVLTKKATNHLMEYRRIVVCLQSMGESPSVGQFCEVLIWSILMSLKRDSPHDSPSDVMPTSVLVDMVKEFPMEEAFVDELTRGLLSLFVDRGSELGTDEFFSPLLRTLSTRYSKAFDEAVGVFLSAAGSDQKSIFYLLSSALPGMQHQVVEGTANTLALSLHHHDSQMRAIAVRELKTIIRNNCSNKEDQAFVGNTILLRLKDTSCDVVREVLDISSDVLFQLVPPTELLQGLMGIIKDFQWEDCMLQCVSIATSDVAVNTLNEDDIEKFILELLPNLLLTHKKWSTSLKMLKTLSSSPLVSNHPLLKGIESFLSCEEFKNITNDPEPAKDKLVDVNVAFLGWFAENLNNVKEIHQPISHLLSYSRVPVTKKSICYFVFANFILSHLIRLTANNSLQLELSVVLLSSFNESAPDFMGRDEQVVLPVTPFPVLAFLNKSTKSANLKRLFNTFHSWVMNIVINSIALPPSPGSIWLTLDTSEKESNWYHFSLFLILDMLTSGVGASAVGDDGDGGEGTGDGSSSTCRTLLRNMFEVQFSGRGWLLRFLALLWTTPSSSSFTIDTQLTGSLSFTVSPLLQARGLQIAAAYLTSLDVQSLVAICTTKCPLIPSLLVPLMSVLAPLRQGSIQCFQVVHQAVDQLAGGLAAEAHCTSPLLRLVTVIVQHSFDILSDPHYLSVVLRDLFHKAGNGGGTVSRSSRRDRGQSTVQSNLMTAISQQGTPTAVQSVLLGNLHLVDHPIKTRASNDLLQEVLSGADLLSQDKEELLEVIIKGFTPKAACFLTDCEPSFQNFLSILRRKPDCTGFSRLQELAYGQVSEAFFSSLETSLQLELLQCIVDTILLIQDTTMVALARSTLQKLPLSADHLSEELKRDFDVMGVVRLDDMPKPKKRKRVKDTARDVACCRRRLCVILELSTSLSEPKSEDHWRLVPLLFQILDHVLDPEDQWSDFDYPCQLLLTQLTICCKQLLDMGSTQAMKAVPEDSFNVELAVKCIRVSSSEHTHHHAFLLLACAAKLYPSRVLHNIMSIFTFMGSNVLRYDNQYSFSVIEQTIDSVIPVLTQGPALRPSKSSSKLGLSSGKKASSEETVLEILHVFVDTLPHIPPHRRLPLFVHLLNSVGVGENLHRLWLLLVYKHILLRSKQENEGAFQYMSFVCNLADHFHDNALAAILRVLQYVSILPYEKPQRQLRPHKQRGLFDPTSHSTRQLLHYHHSLYSLMGSVLSSHSIVQKFTDSPTAEDTVQQLLEGLLVAITTQSQVVPCDDSHTKFLTSVQHKTSEVTQKVTDLFSLDSFLAVMKQLIEGSSPLTQLKAFELLNKELQSPRDKLTTSHKEQLLNMVGCIKSVAMVKDRRQSETSANRIAALYCLKSVASLVAEDYREDFVVLVRDLLGILTRKKPPELLSCSLNVIGEVIVRISVQLIPMLSQLVPVVMDTLFPGQERGVLHSSCSTLLSVVNVLANFISPYVGLIMDKVCVSAFGAAMSDVDLQAFVLLTSIRKQLGRLVPQRVLVPVCLSAVEDLRTREKDEMGNYLDVIEECVNNMSPSDVRTHNKNLLALSRLLLSYRSQRSQNDEMQEVNVVEDRVVDLLGGIVLKMSEANFRPMFLQLFDWSTQEGMAREALIAFYHFTCKMADILKGIFLLFAGHMLSNCAKLLPLLHFDNKKRVFSDDRKNCLLLSYILQTLGKCFLFSKKHFLTKDRFDTLLNPLVDQVSNTLGGTVMSAERLHGNLSPCLAEFGAASGKDVLFKVLNQKLLTKARHEDSQVRVNVIKILKNFYVKLGEEFVILLPETIPYLAEFLEDDSEEVEACCRSLITDIEGLTGESIQDYLSAR